MKADCFLKLNLLNHFKPSKHYYLNQLNFPNPYTITTSNLPTFSSPINHSAIPCQLPILPAYFCAMAEKKEPVILITNDDGITAPGIRNLIEAVKDLGKVVVVAPDKPQSGMGHAITIGVPLRLHKVNYFEGIEA